MKCSTVYMSYSTVGRGTAGLRCVAKPAMGKCFLGKSAEDVVEVPVERNGDDSSDK